MAKPEPWALTEQLVLRGRMVRQVRMALTGVRALRARLEPKALRVQLELPEQRARRALRVATAKIAG